MHIILVNSPSIAGTGRVGPRQKSRVTYSSQSDADAALYEISNFSRQKSFDEKTAGVYFNNGQKSTPKSPFSQRKKESNSKSPYTQRKEFKNDESSTRPKSAIKTAYPQKNESREQRQLNNISKVQRIQKRSQKTVLNKEDNNLSIFDEAIPSEYNPDKSFSAREELIKEKIDIQCGKFEKASGEANEVDKDFSDTFEIFNNSDNNDEFINQNNYDNHIENTNHQNLDNIQIDQIHENNEHIELNENIKNINATISIEHIDSVKNMEDEKIDINTELIETNKNITHLENNDYTEEIYEKFENYKYNVESHTILQNIIQQKNNENSLPDSNIILEITEQKYNLCDLTRENFTPDISYDENKFISTDIQKNELTNTYENDEIQIKLEQEDDESIKINDNSHPIVDLKTDYVIDCITEQLIDNITNDFVELQEKKTTALINSQNKTDDNDSDLIDNNITNDSVEFNKIKVTEIINSEKNSPNDSGFVDDFDKLQNNIDASIIESYDENNTKENSKNPVVIDTMELTKEVCNKNVEICDIYSVASNELIHVSDGDLEKLKSKIDTQDVSIILESNTKDNEVYIAEDINENLESTNHILIQKERKNESIEGLLNNEKSEIVVTEAIAIVNTVESPDITSEDYRKVASDESKEA
jgi:hypothetical protein